MIGNNPSGGGGGGGAGDNNTLSRNQYGKNFRNTPFSHAFAELG
jgi:hypothetical protein